MILIEGPDGTGKSNLTARLLKDTGLKQAPRMSTSTGGGKANLADLVRADSLRWSQPACLIYDRHPLIGEYIYGPILRNRIVPEFTMPLAHRWRTKLAHISLLVLALPALERVRVNVSNEDIVQLDGVAANIDKIYCLYQSLIATWPGWIVEYDYSQPIDGKRGYHSVLRAVRLHAAEWNQKGQASS